MREELFDLILSKIDFYYTCLTLFRSGHQCVTLSHKKGVIKCRHFDSGQFITFCFFSELFFEVLLISC